MSSFTIKASDRPTAPQRPPKLKIVSSLEPRVYPILNMNLENVNTSRNQSMLRRKYSAASFHQSDMPMTLSSLKTWIAMM